MSGPLLRKNAGLYAYQANHFLSKLVRRGSTLAVVGEGVFFGAS
jgi:hypothetical protein